MAAYMKACSGPWGWHDHKEPPLVSPRNTTTSVLRAVDGLYNIIPLLLRQTLGGTEGVQRKNRSSAKKKGVKRKPIIAAVQCGGVVSGEYIQLWGRQEERRACWENRKDNIMNVRACKTMLTQAWMWITWCICKCCNQKGWSKPKSSQSGALTDSRSDVCLRCYFY